MNNQTRKIQLVIFDWAGTTVDFGSRAPAAAFAACLAAHGVEVTDAEARGPMGMNKRDHLVAMLSDPSIAARWESANTSPWTDSDVDTMYEEFIPLQLQAIEQHAELVPDLLDVVSQLRDCGLKIGGTTGYFQSAAEAVARRAAQQGFTPDMNMCADDVPQGRPAPWMIYRIMERLGVFPPSTVVKVGDTTMDIQAGLSAGCWSVGVCDSSSVTGLSQPEFAALSDSEKSDQLSRSAETFRSAGCHAVISSIRELPALIDRLNSLTTLQPHVLPS